MVLSTLVGILLENLLTGKGIITACEGKIRAVERAIIAGQNF